MTQGSSRNFFTSEEIVTVYEGLSQPFHGVSQELTKIRTSLPDEETKVLRAKALALLKKDT